MRGGENGLFISPYSLHLPALVHSVIALFFQQSVPHPTLSHFRRANEAIDSAEHNQLIADEDTMEK